MSSLKFVDKIVDKISRPPRHKKPELEQRRKSWLPSTLILDAGSLFRDRKAIAETLSIPLPEGRQVPNAIFARKFSLIGSGESLPPYLPINQMPTAESKATDTIVEAAESGLLEMTTMWSFRGPFTPQLGFDGGLDYQWGFPEPSITIRPFDLEFPLLTTPRFQSGLKVKGADQGRMETNSPYQRSLSKRQGTVFGPDSPPGLELDSAPLNTEYTDVPFSAFIGITNENQKPFEKEVTGLPLPNSPPYTPTTSCKSMTSKANGRDGVDTERQEGRYRGPELFGNIEFTIQPDTPDPETPASNRKTTVIERSGNCENSVSQKSGDWLVQEDKPSQKLGLQNYTAGFSRPFDRLESVNDREGKHDRHTSTLHQARLDKTDLSRVPEPTTFFYHVACSRIPERLL
ncbi:hypothetical protein F5Y15DRAFT_367932, partial [Xylariaceae sp. FL0016]